ncbi:YsnF/AvaK domain-containing protein [Fibrella aquatilis]|uniref:YsnF/AvaK domain-containing protein n=1 Tax=Fibrella aquatilis TaxID=2817059 RepID=A0A939K387_9BACT|nr:YsnF/AvaK domain-containing protein [Fibrella aquatilis]MBO0934871.1 YsnF/AvaK domain-containing protein [Fibrella aquatilis]
MFPTDPTLPVPAAPLAPSATTVEAPSTLVIPVIDEQLLVSKELVETGQVRVSKHVDEQTQTVETPVWHEVVDVQRILINRVVDTMPLSRQEGDTLILPVVREEVVTSIRFVLVEEVHITRRQEQHLDQQTVTLRSEHITVDRSTTPASPETDVF